MKLASKTFGLLSIVCTLLVFLSSCTVERSFQTGLHLTFRKAGRSKPAKQLPEQSANRTILANTLSPAFSDTILHQATQVSTSAITAQLLKKVDWVKKPLHKKLEGFQPMSSRSKHLAKVKTSDTANRKSQPYDTYQTYRKYVRLAVGLTLAGCCFSPLLPVGIYFAVMAYKIAKENPEMDANMTELYWLLALGIVLALITIGIFLALAFEAGVMFL